MHNKVNKPPRECGRQSMRKNMGHKKHHVNQKQPSTYVQYRKKDQVIIKEEKDLIAAILFMKLINPVR